MFCGPGDPVGTVEPVSVKGLNACAAESQGVPHGSNGAVSADGRFVAFVSTSSALVTGDTNREDDVFVRDRLTGAVERVNVTSSGAQAPPPANNNTSDVFAVAISADGRYVAFSSNHALAPGAVELQWTEYLHDRQTGSTEVVSIAPDGSIIPSVFSVPASISDDGRYVAFESGQDVYVRDRVAGTTAMIATDQFTGGSWPQLSGNGRYVAFISASPNLVPGDTNDDTDVFVYDLVAHTIERVSVTMNGAEAESLGVDNWSLPPSISDDGRYVAFTSEAWNLYGLTSPPAPMTGIPGFHVYVRDRVANTTTRVDTLPTQSPQPSAQEQSISDDGRYVAYMCTICGDNNPDDEVLLTDMTTGQTRRVGTTPEGVVSNGADRTTSVKNMSSDGHWLLFSSTATNLGTLEPNVPSNDPSGTNEDLFLQHIN
jgi:Tol biopolymer transport system component